MKKRAPHRSALGALAAIGLGAQLAAIMIDVEPAWARDDVIKLGTVAPRGTVWAQAADELGAAITRLSDGAIRARTYAGVVGDEATIVRKMRVGQLDGAVLTAGGLQLLAKEPMVLQLPMIFDSFQELDAVRDALEPELNRILDDAGFVVLGWGDAGWFRFFTRRPAAGPEDVRGMKLWMWAHDPHGVRVFQAIGFEPVVLSSVDLVPSLSTGLIDAFPSTSMAALALQAYTLAPHMIDLEWTPVIGATVMTKAGWAKIPAPQRAALRTESAAIGVRFRELVRAQSAAALAEMKRRGLQVHTPSPAQRQAWRAQATQTRAYVRANALPPELVDRVMQLRDQARTAPASAGSSSVR